MSVWAQARFGELWPQVRLLVAKALREAVSNAQDAQAAGSSPTRYSFGSTLFARKYEALATALTDIEGARLVTPKGSPFPLVLLNGCLLLPFRYAQDSRTPIGEARISDRQVSDRTRGLFDKFAPPRYHQDALFVIDDESSAEDDIEVLGPALRQLPAGTSLVLIPFACNEKAGLLNAYWGEANLADNYGRLSWVSEPEQLALPAESAADRHPALTDGSAGSAGVRTAARFDSADLPDLDTKLRPRNQPLQEAERASGTPETNSLEQQ